MNLQYIVLRHRKENLRKCSLRGLENRLNFLFLTYPACNNVDLEIAVEGGILLDIKGDELSPLDSGPLIILDGTWAYAATMYRSMPQLAACTKKRIPRAWRTAYPRYQTACADPERGLASIEAIYAASYHMGRSVEGLLDGYYWKDQFLHLNASLICL